MCRDRGQAGRQTKKDGVQSPIATPLKPHHILYCVLLRIVACCLLLVACCLLLRIVAWCCASLRVIADRCRSVRRVAHDRIGTVRFALLPFEDGDRWLGIGPLPGCYPSD